MTTNKAEKMQSLSTFHYVVAKALSYDVALQIDKIISLLITLLKQDIIKYRIIFFVFIL